MASATPIAELSSPNGAAKEPAIAAHPSNSQLLAPLPATQQRPKRHGLPVRGSDYSPRSETFEGRFGRMFRTLPAAKHNHAELVALGVAMTADAEATPTAETEVDDEENVGTATEPGITAGYTYLGQFIDHDLTFDPNSSFEKQNDPDALVDFRTPRFDLDNVYGRGPDDQPYLYHNDGLHLLQGTPLTGNADKSRARDLTRNTPEPGEPARALIGDPRNDENVIVSQLQGMVTRFHNRTVDFMKAKSASTSFEEVQQAVRWHYQWVVLHDFLPTIVGKDMVASVLPHILDGKSVLQSPPHLKFYKVRKDAYMPLEFSVAAYRFGHSMIRPIYRLNQGVPRFPIFSTDPSTSLQGFRAFPSPWAIDWTLFFRNGNPPSTGSTRVQPAYKIDTSLVNPLGALPASIASNAPPSLAQRNLLRGLEKAMPSGQSVARAMGLIPLPDEKLTVGKATEATTGTNKKLTDLSANFKDNAPLWYYVLAEAQQAFVTNTTPIRLGAVGGRIVTEVMVGLMWEDSHSYLRQKPDFKPFDEYRLTSGEFNMAALLAQAAKA